MAKRQSKRSSTSGSSDRSQLTFRSIDSGYVFGDTAAPPPRSYREPGLEVLGDRIVPGFLEETYGGGELESVPGFNSKRAMTNGLDGIYGEPGTETGAEDNPLVASPRAVRRKYETVYYDPDDDRIQIRNTARIPWRAICDLQITRETGHTTTGTGWFAGSDLVVTAGHNFLNHQEGGFATSIIVTAGHDGTANPPYPPVTLASAYINPRWERDADPSFDYAFLRLADDRLGRRTGYFAFADAPDNLLRGVLVNIAGYPYDKDYGTQWYSGGRLYRVSPARIAHYIDTEGGYSGAPLIYKRGNQRVVLAMHTQGDETADRSRYNTGVRVTGTFFDELKQATGLS